MSRPPVIIGSARPRDGLRTPRTLEEARGPGARLEVERANRWDRIVGRACLLVAAFALALLWAEWLTGGMLR